MHLVQFGKFIFRIIYSQLAHCSGSLLKQDELGSIKITFDIFLFICCNSCCMLVHIRFLEHTHLLKTLPQLSLIRIHTGHPESHFYRFWLLSSISLCQTPLCLPCENMIISRTKPHVFSKPWFHCLEKNSDRLEHCVTWVHFSLSLKRTRRIIRAKFRSSKCIISLY